MSGRLQLTDAIEQQRTVIVRAARLRLECIEPITEADVRDLLRDVRLIVHDIDLAGIEGARSRFLCLLTAIECD